MKTTCFETTDFIGNTRTFSTLILAIQFAEQWSKLTQQKVNITQVTRQYCKTVDPQDVAA